LNSYFSLIFFPCGIFWTKVQNPKITYLPIFWSERESRNRRTWLESHSMSTWQIDVTLGREIQNWYFSWILHLTLRKSLIQRFSLKRLLFGLHHFELNDYFLAKKGLNLQNGPQKCQDMRFCIQTRRYFM
jgi:hypothetical protein